MHNMTLLAALAAALTGAQLPDDAPKAVRHVATKKNTKAGPSVCDKWLRNARMTNHDRVVLGRATRLGISVADYKLGCLAMGYLDEH